MTAEQLVAKYRSQKMEATTWGTSLANPNGFRYTATQSIYYDILKLGEEMKKLEEKLEKVQKVYEECNMVYTDYTEAAEILDKLKTALR